MSLEGMHVSSERATLIGAPEIMPGDRIQTAEGASAVTAITQRPSGEFDVTLANGVKLTIDANDTIHVIR